MSLSSSASNRKRLAVTGAKESGAATTPIALSERRITGLALIRIFVGYLWFQQLFWKMPPTSEGFIRTSFVNHSTRLSLGMVTSFSIPFSRAVPAYQRQQAARHLCHWQRASGQQSCWWLSALCWDSLHGSEPSLDRKSVV